MDMHMVRRSGMEDVDRLACQLRPELDEAYPYSVSPPQPLKYTRKETREAISLSRM